MDFQINDLTSSSDFSGEDYSNTTANDVQDFTNNLTVTNDVYPSNDQILNHYDPLSQAVGYEMPKCNLHIVKPHYVEGYMKADGTIVGGYWRDGENGTGYMRSNPDNTTANNLKP
jgi:hypothetical protein